MTAMAFARAAESLVGARFRLNGRDPGTGIDCIGLIGCALARIGRSAALPQGYGLRATSWPHLDREAERAGFVRSHEGPAPGDVCLVRPSAIQFHFTIVAPSGLAQIEAHAGLRRVVLSPLPADFEAMPRWRLADQMEA
jgi:hypothetical protein